VTSSSAGTSVVPLTGNAITGIIVTPPSFDFGTVPPGSTTPTTLTIVNTDPVNSVTLTPPFAITGADASQFQVGSPAATTLAAGTSTTASVTFAPTSGGGKSATLTIASSAGSTTVSLVGTAQAAGGAAPIVIAEFRVRGSAGGNDEFVEIYNNGDTPADVSGYTMRGSNNAGTVSVRAGISQRWTRWPSTTTRCNGGAVGGIGARRLALMP